jgi:hypothetical protein
LGAVLAKDRQHKKEKKTMPDQPNKAYNKIFFNLGPLAAAAGLGPAIERISSQKIPMFLAATDGMAGLFDLQTAARKYGVPHLGSIRFTGYTPGGFYLENPDFTQPVEVTAPRNWAEHFKLLPPEMDRGIIAVSTINEPRHYLSWGQENSDPTDWPDPVPGYTGWADWLGHFSVVQAQLALAAGVRYFAYGWATGCPEEGAYMQPWQVEYLKLTAQHPGQLGYAINEYSLDTADLFAGNGRLVTRFTDIHDAADRLGVPRPPIILRELGWTLNNAPGKDQAMREIAKLAEILAQHPNILGAGLWTLISRGWGDVHKKIEPLIPEVEAFTLSTTFDILNPAPTPSPAPAPTPSPAPAPGEPNLVNGDFSQGVYQAANGVETPDGWGSHWQQTENPIDKNGWAKFQRPSGATVPGGYQLGLAGGSWSGGIYQDINAAPGVYSLALTLFGDLKKDKDGKFWADDPAGNDGLYRVNGGDWLSVEPGAARVHSHLFTVPASGAARVQIDFMCPFPLPKNFIVISECRIDSVDAPPPSPTPQPLPTGRGNPREDFKRVVWVINHDVSLAQYREILTRAAPGKITVGFSFDDGGIGNLPDRTAVVWGNKINPIVLKKWFSIHYPGVKFQALTIDGDPVTLPDFQFMAWPTEYKRINQAFGANPQNYAQFPGLLGHDGIDFAAPQGSKIFAVAGGTVADLHPSEAGHNYGIFVRVNHAGGYQTTYAHLSGIASGLKVGDYVQPGQVIGLAGNTGNSFGAHLHLTLKSSQAYKGGPLYIGYGFNIVDPTPFVDCLLLEPSGISEGDRLLGKPRQQYKRTYNLILPDSGIDGVLEIAPAALADRETVGYSADDAGIGDLDQRIVKAWASGSRI